MLCGSTIINKLLKIDEFYFSIIRLKNLNFLLLICQLIEKLRWMGLHDFEFNPTVKSRKTFISLEGDLNMRKALLLILAALFMVSVVGVTAAQDATPLTLGEAVEGEITNDEFEILYSFEGSAGQVALIQMWQSPDAEEYVDTELILQGPSGSDIASGPGDPALYSQATIAMELPEDGTYTIIATRYEGRTGESVGPFVLVANIVEPLVAGSKVDATIYGYDSDLRNVPQQYVVQGSGATKISFTQEIDDLFPDLKLYPWVDGEEYSTPLFTLDDTSKVSSAVVSVELEDGALYILTVRDSFS
jgi:hypothetical protein